MARVWKRLRTEGVDRSDGRKPLDVQRIDVRPCSTPYRLETAMESAKSGSAGSDRTGRSAPAADVPNLLLKEMMKMHHEEREVEVACCQGLRCDIVTVTRPRRL